MASALTLLYNNFADRGSLSGGSWLTALPLNNVLTNDVQQVARSIDAQFTSTVIWADLGLPSSIDGIMFGPVNLSPGAQWQAKFYSDAAHTVLLHDTGLQTAIGDVIDWADENEWFEWEDPRFWFGIANEQDALPFYAYHICTATVQAQYIVIEIFDSGNGDGYIEIGRLMIAQAFRPPLERNYDENNQITVVPLTDMVEALGGRRSYWERGVRRKATYAFPHLLETEIFNDVFSVMLRSGISRHVFVVPDSEDTTTGGRRSFLATFSTVPAIRQLLVEFGSTAFDLEEVK